MSWSGDSRIISYSYQSGRPDRDICIGLMPAAGGARTTERCGWGTDDGQWADGLDASTVSPARTLLFVRHRAAIVEPGFRTAELFSYPLTDQSAQPVRIAELGRIPAGAARRWDTFIDPVWLDDGSLLVLGAHWVRRPGCAGPCPADMPRYNGPDTLTIGVELARISGLDAGRMDVTSITAMPGLLSLALDRSKGQLLLVRQYHDPEDDSFYESFADTIFTMPVGGGAAAPLAGTPRDEGPPLERFHSVAAAAGRTFVARSWYNSATPPLLRSGLVSDIAELMPDGTLTARWPAPGVRWRRITAAPDGSALLAEAFTGISTDIYRIPLR